MNKSIAKDETLKELWAVKDETFARFGSATEYFEHLGMKPKREAPALKPSTQRPLAGPRARRARVAQA
jgi:hypothetical protein